MDGKFVVGGYNLTFNVNTFCGLEEAFDVADVNAVLEIINSLQARPSLRTIRTIFHVAMQQFHPETTAKEAGDLISEVGISEAADAIGKGLIMAFPAVEPSAEGNVKKRDGIGTKS
jgi:hypothetical protein